MNTQTAVDRSKRNRGRNPNGNAARGFTLIPSLLIMALLSGLAIGLVYMTNGAGHIGGNDLESNMAFYGAESGMEKMTADLGALYQANLAPTPAQILAVGTSYPTSTEVPDMAYNDSITWPGAPGAPPPSSSSVISQGPNAGLTAVITRLTLQTNATRPSGANASMNRTVEIAQIPVFQFGVFSDSDLSYFAGPDFVFQGRTHTNGNLYLGSGAALILDAKVTAFGQVIRDRLANNYTGSGYAGPAYIPNATGGCDGYDGTGGVPANCIALNVADASWSGSIPIPPGTGGVNPAWNNTSQYTFNGFIGNNASTGVKQLVLPFVQPGVSQAQIIRKPMFDGTATSALGSSQEYYKANIRILLSQNLSDLHPERGAGSLDVEDVDLTGGGAGLQIAVTGVGNQYVGWGQYTQDHNWIGNAASPPFPLNAGWLRVEYLNTAGAWVGITHEWLKLGFARALTIPTAPKTDALNPNAILILEQEAERGTGTSGVWDPPNTIASQFAFYPINFFDPREGFPRDTTALTTSCNVNGIMSAVELNVGNLTKWLSGNIAGSGTLVDPSSQNGYLVYFSDRRGMVGDPNAPVPYVGLTYGVSGIEDVINSSSGTGTPDGLQDPVIAGYNNNDLLSPEDVDINGKLDNWGEGTIGTGFGVNTATVPPNPFVAVPCASTGRANPASGARHVLRLIDGGLNNVPTIAGGTGGFTVASENPLYIYGNYNSDGTDPFWGNPSGTGDIPHSNAAVIADAVTLLSNNWKDLVSMTNVSSAGNRTASTTYFRTGIAAGKNRDFQQPAGTGNDFGTDGGLHNFMRLAESWGGSNLYYRGSLISLYYSQYATGVFKCCNLVYGAPTRKFYFDSEFLNPADLPPGTPELQDVVNLSYWQNFQAY